MRSPALRATCGVLAVMACAASALAAEPQSASIAAAEALFRDGKTRMAANDYARACPKLADSYRLDAATGTLLLLAMCHEREGKFASAWGEYADAAARAKREARADREKAARERAASLESKLSQLTIAAAPGVAETPGIEITRNGSPVGAGTLGTSMPVDGGTYAIEATAPNKKPWRAKVTVGSSGDKQSLTVPALENEVEAAKEQKPRKLSSMQAGDKTASPTTAPAAAPATASATPSTAPQAGKEPRFAWPEITSISAGVVGLGVGTAFLLQAVAKNEQSLAGCNDAACTSEARQDRLDARDAGRVATVAFVAGGALVATGVAIYLIGGATSTANATRANLGHAAATLQAAPLPIAGGFGGVLGGTF